MEITHKIDDELTAHIKIKLTEEDYAEEVKKTLNDYRRKATIKGFRPGKVPFGLINKMYGEAVLAETVNKLLFDALEDYLKKNNFNTLGQPIQESELDKPVNFKTDKEFEFNFMVGIQPEFDVDIDKNIKLKYHNIEIADDAVDKYINDIRQKFGKQEDVETAGDGDAIFGDIVEVDKEGKEVENGLKKENAYFAVDEIKLKGVKANILKMKIGDSLVFNPFRAFKNDVIMSSFLSTGLAEAKNFKSDVKFTLRHISHIEPAELNEELFSKVYEHENIENEEQLRERILRDIKESYEWEGRNQFLNDAVDLFVEKTNLDLPDTFLKRWIIESNKAEEEDKQIPEERIEEEYKNYRDTLRWQLIESKLAKKYGLEVGYNEIKNKALELMGLKVMGGNEEENSYMDQIADSVLQNEEQRKKIAERILEDKLVEILKEKASVEDVKISYDDFVKMVSDKVAAKADKK